MDVIQQWINVIANPLGLAGFALFLVFGVVAKIGRSNGQGWLTATAFSMAFVALVGGLLLSWQQTSLEPEQNASSEVSPAVNGSSDSNTQDTKGDNSPAVQNVEGDVTITITPQQE